MLQGQIDAELRRDEAAAARRNARSGAVGRIGETGRRDMAIPRDAYLRGQQLNGSDCWENEEFASDMKKRYPHLAVPQQGGISICLMERVGRRPAANLKAKFAIRDGKLVKVYERGF